MFKRLSAAQKTDLFKGESHQASITLIADALKNGRGVIEIAVVMAYEKAMSDASGSESQTQLYRHGAANLARSAAFQRALKKFAAQEATRQWARPKKRERQCVG